MKNYQKFFILHIIKTRQTLTSNNYSADEYLFQKKKELININKIDIKKIVFSNKVSYSKEGAYKYYV